MRGHSLLRGWIMLTNVDAQAMLDSIEDDRTFTFEPLPDRDERYARRRDEDWINDPARIRSL